VYKLNGWIPHVLVGYSVIADYIPAGNLPPVVEWHPEVLQYVRCTLGPVHDSLSPIELLILRSAMLGHDIGVVVQIADHDIHGVPLVPSYLQERGITQRILSDMAEGVSLDDFTWAVQAIVRFHALVNRVGVEFSENRSRKELVGLMESADSTAWRRRFAEVKLAPLLLLIAVGDLIAVDDVLLSARQVTAINAGYGTLCRLLRETPETDDEVAAGIGRSIQSTTSRLCPSSAV
jgi:hypothetical protein